MCHRYAEDDMDARERTLLNVAKDLLGKRGELPCNIGADDWAHLSAAVAAYGERVEWRNSDELDEYGDDWMLDEEMPDKLIPFDAHAADHDGGNT